MGCKQSKAEVKADGLGAGGRGKKLNVAGAGFKRKFKKVHNGSVIETDIENPSSVRADFVREIIAKGEPWTDPDLPPVFESLFKEGSADEAENYRDKIEWKRISEITESPKIFIDGITPSDVSQGGLSDCYYLAVLSAMAENPENVRAVFET